MKLILGKEDYDKILVHCRQSLPNEACGLLAGTAEVGVKKILKVYLLTNTDASNEHFSMSPQEQFAALKDARANGMVLIGSFHSHPASPPRPSEEDKRLAYDSSMEYLILSLQDNEKPVLKAFGIDKNRNVTAHEIEVN